MTLVDRMKESLLAVAVIVVAAAAAAAQAPSPAQRTSPSAARPPAAAQQAARPGVPQAPPAPAARSSSDDEVVARIGNVDVRAGEIAGFLSGLGERERDALTRDPALLSQAVRQMLASRLVLKEAQAKKWDQKPEVVEQLQRLRETAIAESYLKSLTEPPAEFPGEAEVKAFYDANQSALMAPRSFRVGQIFIAGARDADKAVVEAARKKVAEVQAKLKRPGADFTAVARSDSDAKGAADSGGDLGWIAENQVRPELRAILLGLSNGDVADAVQMEDGWHILKLFDTRAAVPRPLSEVRTQLVERLRQERATQLRRAYMAELLKRTPPAINELALGKVLSSNLAKPAKP